MRRARPGPRGHPPPPPRPAQLPVLGLRLYASTSAGLEALLAEELGRAGFAADLHLDRARVTFALTSVPVPPFRLLVCDRAGMAIRSAEGHFVGPRGLADVRGKLARTEFDRAFSALPAFGAPAPSTFRVAAAAALACDFMFFDVKREATPIIAHRTGLSPSEEHPDVIVDVEVLPSTLHIGVALPLIPLTPPSSRLPRSVAGAVLGLAAPAPHLTVCDPDCGAAELLRAWAVVAPHSRALGLAPRPVGPAAAPHPPWVAAASPRAWPIADDRLSRVISLNPRLRTPVDFAGLLDETARCLAPGGGAVLLIPADQAFPQAIEAQPCLVIERTVVVRDRDDRRRIVVLRRELKPPGHRTDLTAGDRARASQRLGGVVGRRRREWRRDSGRSTRHGGKSPPQEKRSS